MRQTEFCNHYQAMSDHQECKRADGDSANLQA